MHMYISRIACAVMNIHDYNYHILLLILSNLDTITVQAPQPPSAHPNLVPVRLTGGRCNCLCLYMYIKL